jgi:predicted phosphodiesterase
MDTPRFVKLHILSDLHLEVSDFKPPHTDADVVILAGDIANGHDGIDWARQHFDVPVLYVPGNHEYYHTDLAGYQALRAHAAGSNVHMLDQESMQIGGIRFLGATLWTDFDLFSAAQREQAMREAQGLMLDFRMINDHGQPFTPEGSRRHHRRARSWLEQQLNTPSDTSRATVVITHHGPHRGSVAPRYASTLTSAGFVSNLDAMMGAASLWVHGHTHNCFDYQVMGTRVVCNPRGYVRDVAHIAPENPDFNAAFIARV